MADFSVDLDVLCAPSIKASGGAGLALLRLRASDGTAAQQAAALEPVWVSLYLSTDGRLDSDDIVLVRRQVRLAANNNKELLVAFSTADQAVADGSYYLIARIESPAGVVEVNPANNQSVELVNGRGSDGILTWISCALNAIQSAGSNGKPGVPPTVGTRLMAMLSTAMLDAVAAFGDQVNP